jgi:hypothetical protein
LEQVGAVAGDLLDAGAHRGVKRWDLVRCACARAGRSAALATHAADGTGPGSGEQPNRLRSTGAVPTPRPPEPSPGRCCTDARPRQPPHTFTFPCRTTVCRGPEHLPASGAWRPSAGCCWRSGRDSTTVTHGRSFEHLRRFTVTRARRADRTRARVFAHSLKTCASTVLNV